MIKLNFFRNPEIKKDILVCSVLTIVAPCVGLFFGKSYSVLALCLCLVFSCVHIILTYMRYRKIAKLSFDIDRILHGNDSINLEEYAEGELAVLQNEICKMTVRMREQAYALSRDKAYLADSIADISHQIRTPLTSINLIVSFLSEQELDKGRRLELTQKLEVLLSHIDWLISTLLKISKLDAGTVSFSHDTIYLTQLIRKASEPLLIPMELREQQLIINVEDDVTFVGDIHWSAEAVGNILKNCMEGSPKGGIITVSGSRNTLFTEIVITDNGPGIDKADLPHLFERFYKGKNSGSQGIGIGLALARMIIAAQNGTIKAENNDTSGAKFTIRFYNQSK